MTPLRILLVEDNFIIAELLAAMLGDMGHSVCGTETTEASAVAAAFKTKPDLMIVDVRLAVGSGASAVATISKRLVIPHIFVSGDWNFTGCGNAIVLQKPYTQADLVDAIDRTFATMDSTRATPH